MSERNGTSQSKSSFQHAIPHTQYKKCSEKNNNNIPYMYILYTALKFQWMESKQPSSVWLE